VLETIDAVKNELPDLFADPARVVTAHDLVLMGTTGRVLLRGRNFCHVALRKGAQTRCSLVDRSVLRNALASKLPEGVVRWNAKITAYEHVTGKVVALLEDGSRVVGDVLVGCDGARSHIRAQRAPLLVPAELGIWHLGRAFHIDDDPATQRALERQPLFRAACTGLTRISAPSGLSVMSFVYASPNGERKLLWSCSFPAQHRPTTMAELVARVASEMPGAGADAVLRVMPQSNDMMGEAMCSVLPDTLQTYGASAVFGDDADSLVTLLGDAAHKTTTQAGLGATAAFQDAQDLAHALAGVRPGAAHVGPVLRAYEARMLKRALTVVRASAGNSLFLHTQRSALKHAMISGAIYAVGCVLALVQGPGVAWRHLRSFIVASRTYMNKPWMGTLERSAS